MAASTRKRRAYRHRHGVYDAFPTASERRYVWEAMAREALIVLVAQPQLSSGDAAREAIASANTILAAFDTQFPSEKPRAAKKPKAKKSAATAGA